MTKPTQDAKPVPPPSRAERKALLLAELEQQRVDIIVNSDYLLNVAEPLERNLKSFKLPLYALGGIAAWRLVRHPGGAVAAGRKALAGYMLFRKLKLLAKIAT
ncbi:hypothetical protein ACGK9R_13025 [Halomonas sp. HNIBRBA4712]|uniref:hypothetical protein n=1 Tax=Halomonas sp. HNIBRBA4712 TaxID=3373087 RepID=UPI003744E83D